MNDTLHTPQNSDGPAISPAPLHVLLIDDNEDDAMIARDHLSRVFGRTYHVEWASSFQTGITSLLQKHYDVCLVDYCLNKGTGLDIVTEALDEGCATPIIMISGTTDPTLCTEAIERGAADFLFKAEVNAFSLEQAIDQALARK